MQNNGIDLNKLFISTFKLSAFTFGGGYVIVSLMKKEFVDNYGWLSNEEMLDITAIAQSAPGPTAVNGAIGLGYKLAGIKGVVVATIATILPPFIIITLISLAYDWFKENQWIALMMQGMQAGVSAVILVVSLQMLITLIKSKDHAMILLFILTFIIGLIFKVNVIYLIIMGILLAIMDYFLHRGI